MPSELYDSVPVSITIYITPPELELYQAGILIAAVYARAHDNIASLAPLHNKIYVYK